jgi:hypothetical protein
MLFIRGGECINFLDCHRTFGTVVEHLVYYYTVVLWFQIEHLVNTQGSSNGSMNIRGDSLSNIHTKGWARTFGGLPSNLCGPLSSHQRITIGPLSDHPRAFARLSLELKNLD